MATDFKDLDVQAIKNPQLLQSLILRKYEEATDGKFAVVDGNNPCSFLIEAFSALGSGAVNKIDQTVIPAIYPSRALYATDLYKHMSDYNYLGMFSTPSSCSILLIVDKGYLMRHAVDVFAEDGETPIYKKVIIPQTTRFKIGSYNFGLYYPIEIRVAMKTGMFTVLYDTGTKNPLHSLTENTLEHVFQRRENVELAYIKIPVYQFNMDVHSEPLINSTGYRRVLKFSDKFYAIRVRAEVFDKKTETYSMKELGLSVSGTIYDPDRPTAVFSVDSVNNECVVEVPYVYFTKNLIRGNINIDLYTTAGYLNYQIPSDTNELVHVDMFKVALDATTQKYAEPFRTMPAFGAVPVSMTITGGTDGLSFEELRSRVVNGSFGEQTLQTPADIDAYFANYGYVTSLFKDGITDRIFNAHVVLRNTENDIVAAASVGTLIDIASLAKTNTNTIIQAGDDSYTILPGMRYRFNADKGICTPLTDEEIESLRNLADQDRVAAFNNDVYTMSPFYLQMSLKDKYPCTATYDMLDAKIDSREHLVSRDVAQHLSLNGVTMTTVSVDMLPNDRTFVTNKYDIIFKVLKSGLDQVEATITSGAQTGIKKIRCLVGLKRVDGGYTFADATYMGTSGGVDLFRIRVDCSAVFTQIDGKYAVRIKAPFVSDYSSGMDVYLSTEARVVLCIRDEVEGIIDNYRTERHQTKYLETDFTSGNSNLEEVDRIVALSECRINLHFGKLVNELDQRIAPIYIGNEYETYRTTEFRTLEADKYKLDAYGAPSFTYDESTKKVTLDVLYPKGTLQCYATDLTEAITISCDLGSNVAKCEWADPVDGTWQAKKLPDVPVWDLSDASELEDKEILRKLVGIPVVVKGHHIPRFYISTVQGIIEKDWMGSYDLKNAGDASRGSYSRSIDEWVHTNLTEEQGEGNDVHRVISTYKVRALDALKFIVDKCCIELNGKIPDKSEWYKDPLGSLIPNPREGMFANVTDDGNEIESQTDCQIVYYTQTSDEDPHPSRIYYYKNGAWHGLVQYKTLAELKAKIAEVIANKRTFGYVYANTLTKKVNFTFNDVYDTSDWTETDKDDDQMIKFLNTYDNGVIKLLGGVEGHGEPTELIDEKSEVVLDTDIVWKRSVNLYPWETGTDWCFKVNITDSQFVWSAGAIQYTTRFDQSRLGRFCAHSSGQVKLNAAGKPVSATKGREIQYLINMLHVDAKLAETSAARDKDTMTYPNELVDVMRTHFERLGSVKQNLYTNTKLFFEPMRSLGLGSFYTDGPAIDEYPLDVTMGFRLHVSADVVDSKTVMKSIRDAIIDLIDDHLEHGALNLADIAKEIRETNSDTVKYVDVLGIDGDPNLQTMRCVDPEVRPHLKHVLTLDEDDMTVVLDRGLTLEFVIADV